MSLEGKYIVVGLGVTGNALLEFLTTQGCSCIGFEELSLENLKKAQDKFKGRAASFVFGEFPLSLLEGCSGVFVSPGVPLTRGWVQEAKKRNIPVLGELEWASHTMASLHLQGVIIAVTGTNGKSTTVTLLHSILLEGGKSSSLKGNIGSPLIGALAEPPKDFYVVEVSSFQLETMEQFHPRIAIILNVTEDHLDRYAGVREYAAAKARIFENQKADDYLIYNADDPWCRKMAVEARSHSIPFSLVNRFGQGGFMERENMVIRLGGRTDFYPLSRCALAGLHNQENMLAAVLAATLLSVDEEAIKRGLARFSPLPHRLQRIGSWKGISFYDDSKGTNVGATVMSLASFEKDLILILGGRDKGGDYSPLKPLIQAKVKALIVMGEARFKIEHALRDFKPLYRVETMREAIELSYQIGREEDTVLLSPACSSFDQYKNYGERGLDFQKWADYFGGEKNGAGL